MMKFQPSAASLLAFDTSTDSMSLAVQRWHNGALQVWQHEAPGGALTSAQLIPAIQALMAQAELRFNELQAIVFGCGPGSFTGLRTACAVAQGLAFGAGIPVLPVPTLLALAEEARHQHAPERDTLQVLALLDARMDEMYAAGYAFESGHWTPTLPAQLIRPEALTLNADCVLAGNVFATYGARLAQAGCTPGPTQWTALPTARALLRLAPALLAAGGALPPDQALPLYIRDKVAQTTQERAALKAAL